MLESTIHRIERRLKSSDTMPAETRDALLAMVAQLKSELDELEHEHEHDARKVVQYAEISTQRAVSDDEDPHNLLELTVTGLRRSVEHFEDSHPKLVQLINGISTTLSNIGI